MDYSILPFKYHQTGQYYNRLIVKPTTIPQSTADSGLLTPEMHHPFAELGEVVAGAPDSKFKPGDQILYDKVQQRNPDFITTTNIDGEDYDVIFENEVWGWNDKPVGRIFIEPYSGTEINEEGVIIPEDALSVTQKGIVHDAPPEYKLKKGDQVEYRKQEGAMYSGIILDGKKYEVLFEADIFKVNGEVAPYRIIVSIDMVAQNFKRTITHTGLKRSPLFQAMLYFLQYGEVLSIGAEAHKMYPNLKVGDTAILHHEIEAQPYRLVKKEKGKHGIIAEHRIINCWNEQEYEIMGTVTWKKSERKILRIIPYNDNVFAKCKFKLLDNKKTSQFLRPDNEVQEYEDILELRSAVGHKKKDAAEKAKLKSSGIQNAIQQSLAAGNVQRAELLRAEWITIQREETKLAQQIDKNRLTMCEISYPAMIPKYMLCTIHELYPINLFGQDFLIIHKPFQLAKANRMDNLTLSDFTAINDVVFVAPLDGESTSTILLPTQAKEKPSQGRVISIGENKWDIAKGDFVLFRKNIGLEDEFDGVKCLVMTQNDLLGTKKAAAE